MFKVRSYKLKIISIVLILTVILTGCRDTIKGETYIDNSEVMESECVKESINALEVYKCINTSAEKLGLINDSNPPMFLEFEPDVEEIKSLKIFSPDIDIHSGRGGYGYIITEYIIEDGVIMDVKYSQMSFVFMQNNRDEMKCFTDNGFDFYLGIVEAYNDSKIIDGGKIQIPLNDDFNKYLDSIDFKNYDFDEYYNLLLSERHDVIIEENINTEYMYSICEEYDYPVDIHLKYPREIDRE